MVKAAQDFSQRAGLSFQNPQLLQLALTHSSWTFERGLGKSACNERLEFLGDAVLELCVSEALYGLAQELPEGQMTKIRSLLTREETLAQIAQDLDLGSALLVGKGEESSGGRAKPSNLSNAVEALIAAIYLDQGYAAVYAWIMKVMEPYRQAALAGRLHYDFKSVLQEYVQSLNPQPQIKYEIVASQGPDHNKSFTCALFWDGQELARAEGRSKKEAEQAAAARALIHLTGEPS
ncbi:MAG: ribonuclease III [Eubacteriales bacterium]|nr:ribonuclease III [Eubacteriales bacterium]